MRRLVGIAALVAGTSAISLAGAAVAGAGATTVPPAPAPVTTAAVDPAAATTAAPAAAPTTLTPTTFAPTTTVGPTVAARPAARIASPVADVKIRPTSLPVRTIVITLAVVIIALASAGSVDATGTVTAFDPGLVRLAPDTVEAPGLIVSPALPSLYRAAALIEVDAGHGGSGPPVPPSLIQAIRLVAAHGFENRGDLPVTLAPMVEALIAPHRRMRL